MISGIAISFRSLAERKDLRLAVRCPPVRVESDPILLQRILQNLVSNAIRYTNRGGVLIAVRRRGLHCRIEVIDTGCGIEASERHLVFEEFYRGHVETEDGEPGLGLGLSIVQRMASALSHALVLDSRPRHGTRVGLTVPISTSEVENAAGPDPLATRLTGAHVLIVENDPATADALKRLLQNWDAEVSAHRSLASVAERIAAGHEPPDVLILDYHLDNGACGLDVATYLRGVTRLGLPVIVTTADHSLEIEAQVAALGAELMHKPIKPAQLRALLTHLLP